MIQNQQPLATLEEDVFSCLLHFGWPLWLLKELLSMMLQMVMSFKHATDF